MNTIHGKIWGNTECLFNKNNVSIHRIEAKKGHMCSQHYHLHKHNMLYVETGVLKIEVWQDSNLITTTILADGQSTSIPPGLKHRFSALENTIAFEIYFIELDDSDIIRLQKGGRYD